MPAQWGYLSHYWFIFPALALIEKPWHTRQEKYDEMMSKLREFIDLLPEKIDGDLSTCLDKDEEQYWYTILKSSIRKVLSNHPLTGLEKDFCYDIHDSGSSIAGWNLDYFRDIMDECEDKAYRLFYQNNPKEKPYVPRLSYLGYTQNYHARRKHYLQKAERYLNGERDLSDRVKSKKLTTN